MSEHLPECWLAGEPSTVVSIYRNGLALVCICDRLRACEARVREETQQEFRGFAEAAWAKALAAAWLAVDNTRTGFLMAIGASPEPPERYWLPKDDALAAIDALRGTP